MNIFNVNKIHECLNWYFWDAMLPFLNCMALKIPLSTNQYFREPFSGRRAEGLHDHKFTLRRQGWRSDPSWDVHASFYGRVPLKSVKFTAACPCSPVLLVNRLWGALWPPPPPPPPVGLCTFCHVPCTDAGVPYPRAVLCYTTSRRRGRSDEVTSRPRRLHGSEILQCRLDAVWSMEATQSATVSSQAPGQCEWWSQLYECGG